MLKEAFIRMFLDMANTIGVPALKEYVAKTPGVLDDLLVDALANVMKDQRFRDILLQKI